ncbi:hypothetical protein COV82_05725 [Candidatus Peregrinibacteria bacterium CG11_big_fil_rev_8_21_14_0_20_46_8]|nr:MAG: hypothetical protein COV82_05725 [Candidatus Peregrinibacteria bacterium CG11_big_fil_rev_8_21_14_0_20_46_8]
MCYLFGMDDNLWNNIEALTSAEVSAPNEVLDGCNAAAAIHSTNIGSPNADKILDDVAATALAALTED